MTEQEHHEALLRKVDDYIHDFNTAWQLDGFGVKPLKALRAVVELHKHDNYFYGHDYLVCSECSHNLPEGNVASWPCTTIQAIEKEIA